MKKETTERKITLLESWDALKYIVYGGGALIGLIAIIALTMGLSFGEIVLGLFLGFTLVFLLGLSVR